MYFNAWLQGDAIQCHSRSFTGRKVHESSQASENNTGAVCDQYMSASGNGTLYGVSVPRHAPQPIPRHVPRHVHLSICDREAVTHVAQIGGLAGEQCGG